MVFNGVHFLFDGLHIQKQPYLEWFWPKLFLIPSTTHKAQTILILRPPTWQSTIVTTGQGRSCNKTSLKFADIYLQSNYQYHYTGVVMQRQFHSYSLGTQPPTVTTSCHVHIASLARGLSQSPHLKLGTGCRPNWKHQPVPLTVSNAPSKHFYFSLPAAVKHVLADLCNAPSVRL